MAITNSAGLCLLLWVLPACVDAGLVGTSCDVSCAEAPCASGLVPCGQCSDDRACADQAMRGICDPESSRCVECTHDTDCSGDQECSRHVCAPDDDDEHDEGDASG